MSSPITSVVACCLLAGAGLHAESGYDAWLRYVPAGGTAKAQNSAEQQNSVERQNRIAVPAAIVLAGDSATLTSARDELLRGLRGMWGRTERLVSGLPNEPAILIGTFDSLRGLMPALKLATADLKPEGYLLRTLVQGNNRYLVIAGNDDRGVLYGAFALLRKIATGESVAVLDETQSPYAPIRWVNQWDNLDGSIERGYGGRSIFWDAGKVRADLQRVSDYGRMLASIGINGATIDNVNADKRLLSAEFIPQVARIAAAFRPWGVRIALSVDFGSPQSLGGLDTFDPLDPRVAAWWQARADEVYAAIPDLAGFVLKADSEGRVGPSAYKRTHADAANVVARALKPHRAYCFIAALFMTITWTGTIRRTIGRGPLTTISNRSTGSSTRTW